MLFRSMEVAARTTDGPIFFRSPQGHEIPIGWCFFALLVLGGASLYLLARRIRGAEVVR